MPKRSLSLLLFVFGCGSGREAVNPGDTAGTGGSSGTGGSAGTGGIVTAGASGSSGIGVGGGDPDFVPSRCAKSGEGLPNDAPALEPGRWTDITPPGLDLMNANWCTGISIDPCNPATLYSIFSS